MDDLTFLLLWLRDLEAQLPKADDSDGLSLLGCHLNDLNSYSFPDGLEGKREKRKKEGRKYNGC